MRDLQDEIEVLRLLALCARADPVELEQHLHRDFTSFGIEDGLYIAADRTTYLTFMARAARSGLPNSRVAWIDVRNRIASGCIVQENAQVRRTIVLTLLCDQMGWRVTTATFSADDPTAKDAPPARLQ